MQTSTLHSIFTRLTSPKAAPRLVADITPDTTQTDAMPGGLPSGKPTAGHRRPTAVQTGLSDPKPQTGKTAVQYGLFHTAIQAVWQCKTASAASLLQPSLQLPVAQRLCPTAGAGG